MQIWSIWMPGKKKQTRCTGLFRHVSPQHEKLDLKISIATQCQECLHVVLTASELMLLSQPIDFQCQGHFDYFGSRDHMLTEQSCKACHKNLPILKTAAVEV